MYITFDEYIQLHDPIEEKAFNSFAFEACRVMDFHTTGVDNVKKLKTYFPTDEDDALAVKHCAADIVSTLYQIRQAEISAAQCRSYESTEQGLRGKVISSVSAGNESISFSTGSNSTETAIDAAAADKSVRDKLLADIVREYLSGVTDSNGVNLLYMGTYPRRYLC